MTDRITLEYVHASELKVGDRVWLENRGLLEVESDSRPVMEAVDIRPLYGQYRKLVHVSTKLDSLWREENS